MKKQSKFLYLVLWSLLSLSGMLLSSCGDDAVEEPALYTPGQIRRLLTGGSQKVWQQLTEYYLEDSCRTGYQLRFSENAGTVAARPYTAYFFRDLSLCEPVADSLLTRQVFAPKLPQFATTDSLAFLEIRGGDSIFTYSRIRLLTSQKLLLEFQNAEGNIQQAEYRALTTE